MVNEFPFEPGDRVVWQPTNLSDLRKEDVAWHGLLHISDHIGEAATVLGYILIIQFDDGHEINVNSNDLALVIEDSK